MRALILCLALSGCLIDGDRYQTNNNRLGGQDTDINADLDGDGVTAAAGDCDDNDPAVFPGADERVADGIDQDCDGIESCYTDADGDLVGTPPLVDSEDLDCRDPGESDRDDDCDDTTAAISPNLQETWYDGIDQDCSGGGPATDYDQDGDGHTALDSPKGSADDCDDTNAAISPSATDVPYDGLDQDCSGDSDYDQDGDGYTDPSDPSGLGGDCDDNDADVNPSMDEVPADGIDQDCNGLEDCYLDSDGDGAGSTNLYPDSSLTCTGTLSSPTSDDCNDLDDTIYVGAVDTVGNGVDENCDSADGVDVDGDGSASQDSGGDDCNDADTSVHPGAPDTVGNLIDDNCDGVDGVDVDGDKNASVLSGGADCDDNDPSTYPYSTIGSYCGFPPYADIVLFGPAGGRAGHSVANAGDVNNDGFDDLMIGALGAESVYIVNGPITDSLTLDASLGARIVASGDNDLGGSVAGAGDVNNDGYDDIVVGANKSGVYLFHGPLSGTINLSAADASFSTKMITHSLAVGDLDLDGEADMLVGDIVDNTGAAKGAVYLIHGPMSGVMSADVTFSGEALGDFLGQTQPAMGDLNGTGELDIVLGAPRINDGVGAVYVLYGPHASDRVVSSADSKYTGSQVWDYFGVGLAIAGDVNNDGWLDIVIGASAAQPGGVYDQGAAFVVLGPMPSSGAGSFVATATLLGENASDHAGSSVSGVGDVNGDGYDDILVGAPGYPGNLAGDAYLILGPMSGTIQLTSADVVLTGSGVGELGFDVSDAGDVDNDGLPDLVVGAPGAENSDGTTTGAAYLLLGSSLFP